MKRFFLLLAATLLPVLPLHAGQDLSEITPFLDNYCVSCHSQARPIAILLDRINVRDVRVDAEVWEKIVRELRAHTMPIPSARNRPDAAAYDRAIATITSALDRAAPLKPSTPRLPDVDVAARLANMLWGNKPDEALLAGARKGDLKRAETLEPYVKRMLADPRSAAFARTFLDTFLGMRPVIERIEMDAALKESVIRETELFLEYQIRQDRPIMELFTANYSFLNGLLARHYGLPAVSGDDFRRVTFQNSVRAGLLGQGSFLATTSLHDRTLPTVRGSWLLDRFLGVGVPTPPPNLDPLKEQSAPMRKRLDEVYAPARCAGCHYIAILGYGLENFDQLGRWRDTDAGDPVNASGMMPDGSPFQDAVSIRTELLKRSDAFLNHLGEKLLAFSTGRSLDGRQISYWEMPAVRTLIREAAAKQYRWSAVITGLAKSIEFQSETVTAAPSIQSKSVPDLSGTWLPASGPAITIEQNVDSLLVPRGRVWTYHLNKWGNRFEDSTKQVQARWDGDKLIVVAAPGLRAGTVLEIWHLESGGTQLVCESIFMTAIPMSFDFKESSIPSVYVRTRTVYAKR